MDSLPGSLEATRHGEQPAALACSSASSLAVCRQFDQCCNNLRCTQMVGVQLL
jgi:hypothetical protein